MSVRINAVTKGSPADRAGIRPDESILSVNGEPVTDEIDYQALTSRSHLSIEILGADHILRSLNIRKEEYEPLGLSLDETESMKPRHCRNRCLFCFVDQLPAGMRETLYVKDDDWRLSLMMGNYVTLTNVNEEEFERIIRRKASPLYISVHATDPRVRCAMLRNPTAGNLMDRLKRLRDNGMEFHSQVVLCPGVNDGAVLEKTVEDLSSLYPASRSLAIVPVGLTRHREGLEDLKGFDAESASNLIRQVKAFQEVYLRKLGTRFVYPSDEFYCICGGNVPGNEEYEDYPQIENGVGMLRLLEQECEEAYEFLFADGYPETGRRRLLIPTGTSVQPFITHLVRRFAPETATVQVLAVRNRFFGESITVTGLIVGQDLVASLQSVECDEILICDTMLRDRTDCFLDDMTLKDVENALQKPVRVVQNHGESLIRALWNMEDVND